jgi:hypothetical protein cdivTM_06942
MKRLLREKIPAWFLCTIFFGLAIHAPLTVWVGAHWPDYALFVKAWKEVLLLIVLLLVVIDVTLRRQWQRWLSDRIIQLALAFALWHGVVALLVPTSGLALLSGLLIDLRFVALGVTVYVFVSNYPQYRRWLLRMLGAGAVIVIGFAAAQLVLPRDVLVPLGYGPTTIEPYQTVDSNSAYVRINSTLRGPNPLGAYASTVLTLIVAYSALQWRRISHMQRWVLGGMVLLAALAVWQSYSRSALLAVAVGVGIVAIVRAWQSQTSRRIVLWGVGAVLGCGVIVGSIGYARDPHFIDNVILHNDPTHGPTQTSDSDRITSLQAGLGHALQQPLGTGVGSTGSASLLGNGQSLIIENHYLFVAHEIGWIGLLLLVALTTGVLVKLWHRRSYWLAFGSFAGGIGLTVIGLFLPVFVDDTVSMLWWGLAALAITEDGL